MTDLRPGSVVAWWDGRRLAFAVLADVDGSRVRLVVGKGAEARVAASRIAVEVEPPGKVPSRTPDDLRAAGKRATEAGARVRERAAGVDVPLLWDIVGESGREQSHREMAELALGSPGGEDVAALLVALETEGLHFQRHGETFAPRGRAEVEELLRQRETAARREAERVAFFDGLRALVAGNPHAPSGSETERRHLAALETLAIHEDAAPEAARALALGSLSESGVGYERPHEGAFKLLRLWGRFESDDENLQLLRAGLVAEFPADVLARARESAARGFDFAGRERLVELPAMSIDSASTTEIDDVLTVEERAEGFTLGVHIADPSVFVERGDVVDREALGRGLTWYLAGRKVLMLPPPLSEDAASLREGIDRPALSFTVRIDREGRIEDYRVARSVVRSHLRLDYAAADVAIATGTGPAAAALVSLSRLAEARERERLRSGAIVLRPVEVLPRVGPDGRPVLERLPAESPSRRAVAEAMVVAGEVAARILVERHTAAAFRRQAPLPASVERPEGPVSDPVRIRAYRRALRRAEVGLEPGPHAGLGLAAYVQISSPLRRFQDLAGHRQLLAALGQGVPYTTQEMQRIAASTERAEADARRAERATNEFWLLRWLEERGAAEHAGIVVEVDPRPVVQLDEAQLEVPAPALAGTRLGERVTVRIERVNPRAGVLVLRPV